MREGVLFIAADLPELDPGTRSYGHDARCSIRVSSFAKASRTSRTNGLKNEIPD